MCKPSFLVVPLVALLAACGGEVNTTCLVQRPTLGGYLFVMDRSGGVTGRLNVPALRCANETDITPAKALDWSRMVP